MAANAGTMRLTPASRARDVCPGLALAFAVGAICNKLPSASPSSGLQYSSHDPISLVDEEAAC